jgi:PIN domain nuclease of toxin-antitoxin system
MGGGEREMSSPLLLDTCAAIWLAEAETIAPEASQALEEAYDAATAVYVSPITAWEIGQLVSRGRLALLISQQLWFERLFEALNFKLADMSPRVLIASSFLPGAPPRDPADRILAATAREYGYHLVTRDRPLLEYGEQGHILAVKC